MDKTNIFLHLKQLRLNILLNKPSLGLLLIEKN